MKTLGTAFKQVYGEALKEYGFKKIKGKYPYFVRLIGDEIVHVITFSTRPMRKEGYKEYCVYGGVATVYRNCLELNIPVTHNFGWFKSVLEFYEKKNRYRNCDDKFKKWYTFSYKADDEVSLIESLQYSLEITKEVMLPILDDVTDLKACVKFYEIYSEPMLNIYIDKDFGRFNSSGNYNEGLLSVKVYNVEQFVESEREAFNKNIELKKYLMQLGKTGYTEETLEKSKIIMQESMLRQIDKFKTIINIQEEYDRVIMELERRRELNTEKLKQYGIK